jgi:hypothetical protein
MEFIKVVFIEGKGWCAQHPDGNLAPFEDEEAARGFAALCNAFRLDFWIPETAEN